jgi:hypothetical protein
MLGTLLTLAAAALVVVLVVVPLLDLRGGGGNSSPAPSTSVPTDSAGTPAPGTAVIPETVGLPTAEAIQRASDAGLNWRVECAEDTNQPEGIIGQEPPAGSAVAPGSRFTMFSARISDCR